MKQQESRNIENAKKEKKIIKNNNKELTKSRKQSVGVTQSKEKRENHC